MKKHTALWIGAALAAGTLVLLGYRNKRTKVQVGDVGPGAGSEVLSNPCEAIAPQPDTLPGARSFIYRKAKTRDLRLHVFAPEGDAPALRPAVLFFFGGAWRVGDITAFQAQAEAFAARGYVAVLADYRVKCRDGSTPLDSLRDAQAAYLWLRTHAGALGIDTARMVLSGGSAGGHLALATAMKVSLGHKPAAVVLFNPAVDLVTKAPMALKLVARHISPSVLSVKGLPPTLIFHGQEDRTVLISSVRNFRRRAQAGGRTCQLDEYAGQDHAFYHLREVDPQIGVSPYDDTLARALAFLDAQGVGPR